MSGAGSRDLAQVERAKLRKRTSDPPLWCTGMSQCGVNLASGRLALRGRGRNCGRAWLGLLGVEGGLDGNVDLFLRRRRSVLDRMCLACLRGLSILGWRFPSRNYKRID